MKWWIILLIVLAIGYYLYTNPNIVGKITAFTGFMCKPNYVNGPGFDIGFFKFEDSDCKTYCYNNYKVTSHRMDETRSQQNSLPTLEDNAANCLLYCQQNYKENYVNYTFYTEYMTNWCYCTSVVIHRTCYCDVNNCNPQ